MKAFARHSVLAAAWIAGALLSTACQSQSAGELCDPLNGTADCASGLICGSTSKVCCDPNDPACGASTGTGGGSGAAGAGGASQGDAAPDGPKESGEAATSEAASEAATSEAATSDGASMSSETGADAGAAKPDAADGTTE